MIEIEQCDRETYAAYLRLKNGEHVDPVMLSNLLAGEMDHTHGVQISALARARALGEKKS